MVYKKRKLGPKHIRENVMLLGTLGTYKKAIGHLVGT
jgi:hypothetical protein